MTNLYIPICGFLCSILLIISFYSKERVKNNETNLFSKMLIVSLIDSILMILINLTLYIFNESTFLFKILNKLDYIQLLIWISLFFQYIVYISYKDSENIDKIYKKIYKITSKINKFIMVLVLLLPIQIHNENNILYSYGLSCNVLYVSCAIYVLAILITFLINVKKIFNRKFIPLYIFVVFTIIILIMKNVNPGIPIVSAVLAYVNLIMYFTIENPDVKMIEELEQLKTKAEEANLAKTEFISSISHEIRTPLNAIIGFSECTKTTDDIYEIRESIEDIIKSSKTLLDVVNGLLDISKIENKKIEINNSPYNAQDLFIELKKIIKTKIDANIIDFETNIAKDLPNTLYGDSQNIKKVIINILLTTLKHKSNGNIKYDVKCINNKDICRLIISIEDFRSFTSEENKDIEVDDSVMNITEIEKIIELMGGKLNIQNQYDNGTKYTITLDQVIEKNEIKEQKDMKMDLSGKKILIVDDNEVNLKVATKILEKHHPIIEICNSGYACIEKIKNNEKYDLILMDDMMPQISGVETLKELKKIKGFNTKTVVLTANALEGEKEKYLKAGFTAYLSKPINKNELNSILFKYLYKTIDFGRLPDEMYEIGSTEEIDFMQPVKTIKEQKDEALNSLNFLIENDVDVENAIKIIGNINVYNDNIKKFIKNYESRIEKLDIYIDNEDMKNYSIEIRELKKDSECLGFTKFVKTCSNHEVESREDNVEYIKHNYKNLKEEYKEIIEISKEYILN